MELLRKPNLLQSCCDKVAAQDQDPTSRKLTYDDRQFRSFLSVSESSQPLMPLCSCNIGTTCQSGTWSSGPLNLFHSSSTSRTHQRGCPLRIPPKKKTIIGMRCTFSGLLLSRLISLSMSISHGAGGLSISPNLTFRAIVSDDSPAFALLAEHSRMTLEEVSLSWDSISQEIYKLFREHKASPSDVNSTGETLLHVCDH